MTGGTPARVDRRTGGLLDFFLLVARGPFGDVEGGLGAPSRSDNALPRDCVPGSQAERTPPCPVAPQIAPKPNINKKKDRALPPLS